MPKAVISLSEHANRIVNVVKAKEGLKGKSEAVERIVEEFARHLLDPPLRPGFARDLGQVRKGPFRRIDRQPADPLLDAIGAATSKGRGARPNALQDKRRLYGS